MTGNIDWQALPTLVTGGASFIGSHLVEALVARGARVRVADDLSSGRRENIAALLDSGAVEFVEGDLRDRAVAHRAAQGMSAVFHLAANHGGRGYIDTHQVACSTNLALDSSVFSACRDAGVEHIVYASSGCVYPTELQSDASELLYLSEDRVGPPYDADRLYGWAKLMGELTLREYTRETGMKTASLRYFTTYGPRCQENHAIIAMIARAFIGQNPFVVWGNGEQVRNWTHVSDIVEGTILAAELVDDGTAINLGTMERTRVIDCARQVLEYTGHRATIELHPEMPTGPVNRVADNGLARQILQWTPGVSFVEGLHSTIDWYFSSKNRDRVSAELSAKLLER
jgi:nucleoside-diphosphate-sugar epimerase